MNEEKPSGNEIKTIPLALPFRLGTVNCYLVETSSGYILVDTGASNSRATLEQALHAAGCVPGNLLLILLTHGDFDHTGNAAYLQRVFGARVALHPGDMGMLEQGDMFYNRKKGNRIIRTVAPLLFHFGRESRLPPDLLVEDGFDLAPYGLEAHIVHIPGHSAGSIGILSVGGDLISGDLFDGTQPPALGSIIDDPEAARASVDKLGGLGVIRVYPGHGKPFDWEELAV